MTEKTIEEFKLKENLKKEIRKQVIQEIKKFCRKRGWILVERELIGGLRDIWEDEK